MASLERVHGGSRAAVAAVVLRAATVLLLAAGNAQGASISDEESRTLLAAVEGSSQDAAREAIERIVDAGDRRFAAVFIELIRASQIGIAAPSVAIHASEALERLSGESFGQNWGAWVRWYAGTELVPAETMRASASGSIAVSSAFAIWIATSSWICMTSSIVRS